MQKPFLAITALLILMPGKESLALDPPSDRIVVLLSVDGLAHYYFDDPKAEMPNIRKLASEGARAEKMKASLPTVTWPNHTTLVTGVHPARHGVLGNNVFDRAKNEPLQLIVDPVLDKVEIVTSPTIYDLAHQAGLKTAAILWPATRSAPTIHWCLPEVSTPELIEAHTTPGLLKEFDDVGIPHALNSEWRSKAELGKARDRLFVQMFNHVVAEHRPNLALLHLVDLDHVEHAHGPQTSEAYDLVKFEDRMVGEVWNHLKAHFPGRASLFVISDHGFFAYRQQILPNVLLRQENLLEAFGGKISGGQVRAISQGGACFLYVLDEPNRESLKTRLAARFKEVEGVDLVIETGDFDKYGLADPAKNPHMADLVLSAKEGYAFSESAGGEIVVTEKSETTKGTHGYDPNQPKMHATFVAWGAGIKGGTTIGTIENTSVAPTAANLLGLKMNETDGPVLTEILSE